MSSYLRRQSGACAVGALGSAAAPPAVDQEQLPALTEFLTAVVWPDGAPRQPGSLLLFFEGGKWKACVSDRAQGMVAFLTVPDLLESLQTLEEALRGEKLEWRAKRHDGDPKARR